MDLHVSINVTMARDPAQTPYLLNQEEVRSMQIALPFLRPLCEATDRCNSPLSFCLGETCRVQMNETNLRTLYSVQRSLEEHVALHLGDPILGQSALV